MLGYTYLHEKFSKVCYCIFYKGHTVVSKRDPSTEVSTAETGTTVIGDTSYAVTPNKDSIDIVSVDVNTSHSIEKYPEVITI